MPVSQSKDKYLKHLQMLIDRWNNLAEVDPIKNSEYYELYELSKTAMNDLCTDSRDFFDEVGTAPSTNIIYRFIGKLRATRLQLDKDFLRIEYQIQDKVTVDLMQQAQELLEEGAKINLGHIPAAVLAGAVMENFLRTLCARQSPPIALTLENGNQKTLATLVNDLEKVDLYNSAQKKQLRVWVDIRNSAAHGQFDKFEHKQVEEMIVGIREFIEKYQSGM